MSTLEELDDLDRRGRDDKKRDSADGRSEQKASDGDEVMKDKDEDDILDNEILGLSTQDIQTRKRLLENDSRIMKSELSRLSHEKAAMGEKIKDNEAKIANNRQVTLPTLHFGHSRGRLLTLELQTTPLLGRERRRVAGSRPHGRVVRGRC